jgi:hypothetical protein
VLSWPPDVVVGIIVGSVVGTTELIIELSCEESELKSEDSDETIVETVVSVGIVKPELVDEALGSLLDGSVGTTVGRVTGDVVDMIELIIELRSEDNELIPEDKEDTIVGTVVNVGKVIPELNVEVEPRLLLEDSVGIIVGNVVGNVGETTELITELKPEDKELISEESDETMVDKVLRVGSVKLELSVEDSRPVLEVAVGKIVGNKVPGLEITDPELLEELNPSLEVSVGRMVGNVNPELLEDETEPLDVKVGKIVKVLEPAELIIELTSDDSDDMRDESVVRVGSVKLELLDALLEPLEVRVGNIVGMSDDCTELIIELSSDDREDTMDDKVVNVGSVKLELVDEPTRSLDVRVGNIVGRELDSTELMMELSSDDSEDTIDESVVNVGIVTPELLDVRVGVMPLLDESEGNTVGRVVGSVGMIPEVLAEEEIPLPVVSVGRIDEITLDNEERMPVLLDVVSKSTKLEEPVGKIVGKVVGRMPEVLSDEEMPVLVVIEGKIDEMMLEIEESISVLLDVELRSMVEDVLGKIVGRVVGKIPDVL